MLNGLERQTQAIEHLAEHALEPAQAQNHPVVQMTANDPRFPGPGGWDSAEGVNPE